MRIRNQRILSGIHNQRPDHVVAHVAHISTHAHISHGFGMPLQLFSEILTRMHCHILVIMMV